MPLGSSVSHSAVALLSFEKRAIYTHIGAGFQEPATAERVHIVPGSPSARVCTRGPPRTGQLPAIVCPRRGRTTSPDKQESDAATRFNSRLYDEFFPGGATAPRRSHSASLTTPGLGNQKRGRRVFQSRDFPIFRAISRAGRRGCLPAAERKACREKIGHGCFNTPGTIFLRTRSENSRPGPRFLRIVRGARPEAGPPILRSRFTQKRLQCLHTRKTESGPDIHQFECALPIGRGGVLIFIAASSR